MTLTARRFRREGPEQWTATLTLDKGARVIELGPYKTLGPGDDYGPARLSRVDDAAAASAEVLASAGRSADKS